MAGLAAAPCTGLDWDALPQARNTAAGPGQFDAVIIGAGLGGLSCAAAFARKGYRPVVLEQHDRPGGYATAFRRKDFLFDVSLHSTTVGERNGVRNLIGGFPEIGEVEFVPHPHLYRAILPEIDIRVPQRDLAAYTALLVREFPEERAGIEALIEDMRALAAEIRTLAKARGRVDMSRFAADFPMVERCSRQTWGEMLAARVKDPKLQAVLSALWPYYGLPPSRLSSFYYALPTLGYLEQGGYYPRGRSQDISDALVRFIRRNGGSVLLRTGVERILTRDGAAYGVRCADGREFLGRVIVSNASAPLTFDRLLPAGEAAEYKERMAGFSTSLSSFQVFLGLKTDLVRRLDLSDSEIFIEPGYNLDAAYEAARTAAIDRCWYGVTLYDNLYRGYSPAGKNTVNLIALQGFDYWAEFERDYHRGRKKAYKEAKEKMAARLIQRVEERLLPGLSKAIEVQEIGTPLTNMRYTGNHRGAIYGWDQTLDNSGAHRVGHGTPVRNLYLAGAWSRPGHGYGGVLQSGLDCFAEIVRGWS